VSGGGDKTQTVTQKNDPPAWAVSSFQDMLARGNEIADTPYVPYTGQLVAGQTPDQYASQQMIRDMATGPSIITNGQQYAAGLLGGQGQYQGGYNPYFGATNSGIGDVQAGSNPYLGVGNNYIDQIGGGVNPYMGATNALIGNISAGASNPYIGAVNPLIGGITGGGTVSAGTNKFAGSNPYLGQMIADSSRDVTDAFSNTQVPQLLAQFQTGGAFGGTAMQNAMSSEQNTLAQNLADLSNQYRFQDYQTQQQMDEARLQRQAQLSDSAANRNMQASIAAAQLYDQGMARSAGLYSDDANRALSASLSQAQLYGQDLGRNAQLGDSAAGRALEGSTSQASLFNNWLQSNAALGDSAAARQLQAATTRAGLLGDDLSRNSALGESALGRDLQAWQAYQGNQLAALGMLPSLNQSQYLGASMLGTQGQQQQALNQAWLDQNYQQFLDARNWDVSRFNPLLQSLAAVQGGTVQSTSPYQGPSPAAGALGGAASGAAMGSAFGPMGTGIGAVAGGLMGYFGSR
jgi:hypothetical protein